MSGTLIRAVLALPVVQEILAAIQGVAGRLPFLAVLSPDERKRIPKTGRKRLSFVEKAAEVVRQNPGLCPKDFDGDGFVASATLFSALMPIFVALTKLYEEVSDTTMQVGSDTYMWALDVYEFTKRMAKRSPGLDSAKSELARLLKASRTPDPEHPRKRRTKKPPTPPPTTGATGNDAEKKA